MSIESLQMHVAERTSQTLRPSQSDVAVSSTATAAGASSDRRRLQDQVQLSDQARKLSAALGEAEVELKLSPAKLREMVATTPVADSDTK